MYVRQVRIWKVNVADKNLLRIVKKLPEILGAKLRGHYEYYGVSGNYGSIRRFYRIACRLAYKWMNRRSQKKSVTLERFWEYLRKYPLPLPKIRHNILHLEWQCVSGY